MAFVNGYVNGEPAEIPDNFVQLWPDIYSLTPPEAQGSEETPAHGVDGKAPEGAAEIKAPERATETAANAPQGGRR